MSRLPSGTVTFLFTDIEGSTQLWEKHPEAMKDALAQHDLILQEAIASNEGYIIKTTGDGIQCIAYILSKKDDPQRALTILGAADSLRRMIGSSPTPVERDEYKKELSILHEKMDASTFERLWQTGQMLSLDNVIALAIQKD